VDRAVVEVTAVVAEHRMRWAAVARRTRWAAVAAERRTRWVVAVAAHRGRWVAAVEHLTSWPSEAAAEPRARWPVADASAAVAVAECMLAAARARAEPASTWRMLAAVRAGPGPLKPDLLPDLLRPDLRGEGPRLHVQRPVPIRATGARSQIMAVPTEPAGQR